METTKSTVTDEQIEAALAHALGVCSAHWARVCRAALQGCERSRARLAEMLPAVGTGYVVIDSATGREIRHATAAEIDACLAGSRIVKGCRFGGAVRINATESVHEASDAMSPESARVQDAWAWL